MKEYVPEMKIINEVEYITNWDKHAPYVCMPTEYIDYWSDKLSYTEFGVAYRLSSYINKHDNILKIGQKFLNVKDMATALNLEYSVMRRVMGQLLKQNAVCRYYINICETKYVKAYILNPSIAYHENALDDKVINIFKDKRLVDINNALYSNSSSRNTSEYRQWVSDCLERDDYTCQCCGSNHNLEVHHILNYRSHKELRTIINNGITLCECCHSPMILGSFHQTYGVYNNTKEQLEEYMINRKKSNSEI